MAIGLFHTVLDFSCMFIYSDSYTCQNKIAVLPMRQLGRSCTFDPLSDLWLPQECTRAYNEEYVNFKDSAPWRYWADEEGNFEIFNRSSNVDGQHYWSTEEEHIVHCAFMILRFADTLDTGVGFGLDGRKTLTEHMSHCTKALLSAALTGNDLHFRNTEPKSGIGRC